MVCRERAYCQCLPWSVCESIMFFQLHAFLYMTSLRMRLVRSSWLEQLILAINSCFGTFARQELLLHAGLSTFRCCAPRTARGVGGAVGCESTVMPCLCSRSRRPDIGLSVFSVSFLPGQDYAFVVCMQRSDGMQHQPLSFHRSM